MTKVETNVPDSTVNQIRDDTSINLNLERGKSHSINFIKYDYDAHKIGPKQRREGVFSNN
jgi:hypothetical protein